MAIRQDYFEDPDGRERLRTYVECDGCGDYADNLNHRHVDPDAEHYCLDCEAKRCPRCGEFNVYFPDLCETCIEADDRQGVAA